MAVFWNPNLAEEFIFANAAAKLDKIAGIMAEEVKKSVPEGEVTRPVYQSGPYAGKYWTARESGSLKKSVRVTKRGEGRAHNTWVMVGHTKAYYGKIREFKKPYFRPAVTRSKAKITRMLRSNSL